MGYCKRCVTPSTRPRIGFRDGICNACHWHDYKKNIIDWDHRKTLLYQWFISFLDFVDDEKV